MHEMYIDIIFLNLAHFYFYVHVMYIFVTSVRWLHHTHTIMCDSILMC